MSVGPRLSELVERARADLARRGISTRSVRELSNGIRAEFSDGESFCRINFYYSDRKGFSVIPAGGAPELSSSIRSILTGSTGQVEGNASFGMEARIGTDEASSDIRTRIGTDEAGKGDYMGPLTVAAVIADDGLVREFAAMGIRDSKTLGDTVLRKMAERIRNRAAGQFRVVSLTPLQYNRRLKELNDIGKNSLDLLALCHAEAITGLVRSGSIPDMVIIDRFCGEGRIAHLLPRGDYTLELRERAESDPAVAAASILARDAYMQGLNSISEEYGIGAVPGSGRTTDAVVRLFVDRHGPDVLYRVAKVHFSNTSKVLSLFD